jgi:L-alanine-DL-glutamate epimerase-like enolase superfamily enzyme
LGGKIDKQIYTDYTVSLGSADKMSADAIKIVEAGFTIIKVKLGGSEEDDFFRMKSIREAVGDDIPIRIDANQGWTTEVALRLLEKFKQFNIQLCEEPISRHDYMQLPMIKSKSEIPIMADESCMDHHDAKRLIAINACDSLNIKLGKSGGIFNAIKIIRLAEQSELKLQAGGFLESRLGFTAIAHLVMSSQQFRFYDFDTPLMFSEDPVSGGIEYLKHGEVILPKSNGLGATVSSEVLAKLESITIN